MKLKKLTVLSLLTATALIMFIIEAQIPLPIPIPGVKLGLSNIVTTCVLFLFGWKEALAVLLVRVLLGSMLTGTLGSLAYSLAGGLLSLLGMLLLRKLLSARQLWVAGVIGGMLHNIGQIAAAVLLCSTVSLLYYLPFLLVCGILAGLFTGLCAQLLQNRLKKIFDLEESKQ